MWVSSNEVDEPGAYYTEWSKSERERQILYINAYIWNLERPYQWSYIQGSKGDTDIKKRLLDSVGEGKGRIIWENRSETGTLSYVKQMTSESSMQEAGHSELVLCNNPEGERKEVEAGFRREGTHVYLWLIHFDVWQKPSQCCKVNYPPIKIS